MFSPYRDNLSVRGVRWFLRYLTINFFLLFLLTFLTTPTIIINTMDKFNVTKPLYLLNVRLVHADTRHSSALKVWNLQLVLFFSAEPSHQSVPPHAPAVVFLCLAAHHSLLFNTWRGTLEQVHTHTHTHWWCSDWFLLAEENVLIHCHLCLRSSEQLSIMRKLYFFLLFMVLILPSLGLTR